MYHEVVLIGEGVFIDGCTSMLPLVCYLGTGRKPVLEGLASEIPSSCFDLTRGVKIPQLGREIEIGNNLEDIDNPASAYGSVDFAM